MTTHLDPDFLSFIEESERLRKCLSRYHEEHSMRQVKVGNGLLCECNLCRAAEYSDEQYLSARKRLEAIN